MSWGFNEFPKEASYNSYFTTPAGHTGITFIAASGDSGAQGSVEWPSAAPSVLAVGGTTLFLGLSGNYQSELAWVDSGGGHSLYEPVPSYQRSVQSGAKRSTPDVAFDADPNTGVLVYQTSLLTGQGSWQIVGGTSLGTPAWAAIIAIADQGRALAGKGSLDGATQTLPALYSVPRADYHTVVPVSHRTARADFAGLSTATGLGSPDGASLVTDLARSNVTMPLTAGRAHNGGSQPIRAKRHIRKSAAARDAVTRWAIPPSRALRAKMQPRQAHTEHNGRAWMLEHR
jgi:hypothetical protein